MLQLNAYRCVSAERVRPADVKTIKMDLFFQSLPKKTEVGQANIFLSQQPNQLWKRKWICKREEVQKIKTDRQNKTVDDWRC